MQSKENVEKFNISLGRRIVLVLFMIVTIMCSIFTYRMYKEAKKMWDLGSVDDLYNVPCTVEKVLASHEVLVKTLNDTELTVSLGPLDKDVKVGDSVGVVYDKNNNAITSFNNYYQIIQITLLSILITGLSLVVTICFGIVSLMDMRDRKREIEEYYLDEDYTDEEFEQYLVNNESSSKLKVG